MILNLKRASFILFLTIGFFSKTNAQAGGSYCSNCPLCVTVDFNGVDANTDDCLLTWYWRYPGTPNCGDAPAWSRNVLNNNGPFQAPCRSCLDGPCQCPAEFYVVDGSGNTLFFSNIFNILNNGNPYPYTITNTAFSTHCMSIIEFTYTVNGPNNFSVSATK